MKIIEWFGGIGAASKAVANTLGKENVEIVDYVELDKHACKSYNAIHGTNFVPTDINDVDVSNYPEVDLLIAGWPCQDLSTAGKQAGMVDGTRSNLVYLTIQKINEMKYKPKHILLENVKGLLSKKFEADFKNVLDQFRVMGYNASYEVLNSKYFGIPQSRERVFILLTRVDLPFKDLKPLLEFKTVDKVLRDVLDYNENTFRISVADCLEFTNFYTIPRQSDGELINGFHNRVWKDTNSIGTITSSAIPKFGYVIKTTNKLHYRKLTAKECFRLMGFDDTDYANCKKLNVSESQIAKQAGNSIVVNVLQEIIKIIKEQE